MSPGMGTCLRALADLHGECGESFWPFKEICRRTAMDQKLVRVKVRALKRGGLAEFASGLITWDGEFAGAGYRISDAGLAWVRLHWPESTP